MPQGVQQLSERLSLDDCTIWLQHGLRCAKTFPYVLEHLAMPPLIPRSRGGLAVAYERGRAFATALWPAHTLSGDLCGDKMGLIGQPPTKASMN